MSKTTDTTPKTTNKESPEQPQFSAEPVTPLSEIVRANKAYELVHGDDVDSELRHGAINTAESAAYLEATDAPEELRDQMESLIMQRASDEVKIAAGVIRTKNGAYII